MTTHFHLEGNLGTGPPASVRPDFDIAESFASATPRNFLKLLLVKPATRGANIAAVKHFLLETSGDYQRSGRTEDRCHEAVMGNIDGPLGSTEAVVLHPNHDEIEAGEAASHRTSYSRSWNDGYEMKGDWEFPTRFLQFKDLRILCSNIGKWRH